MNLNMLNITVVNLKEEGKFLGLVDGKGYIYYLLGRLYAIGSHGVKLVG